METPELGYGRDTLDSLGLSLYFFQLSSAQDLLPVWSSELVYGLTLRLVLAGDFTWATLLKQRITYQQISQGVSALASVTTLTQGTG